MKRDAAPDDSLTATPAAAVVELALTAVEASAAFASSRRHRALLRHLVERALTGDTAVLKESLIGVEVFGRSAARFDPKTDSIVRVEARRLRARLAAYYAGDGRGARVRIELPVGSYVPQIVFAEQAEPPVERDRRARDLVERGEHFLRQPNAREPLEKALDRFDQAIRIDPLLGSAYVGLGRAWLNLATGWHREPAIAAEHAAEALRHALALDPDDAVTHALLAAIENQFERDWPGAQQRFDHACRLAPEVAFVHSAYGSHLLMRGEADRAERELLIARRLDPLYITTRSHLVNLHIARGRIDEARAEIDAMRDLAPDSIAAIGLEALVALGDGDAARAITLYAGLMAQIPDHPTLHACLAGAQAAAGDTAGSDATLAALHARFSDRLISPYALAIVEARAGRKDAAFALLARADAERDPSMLMLPDDPSFVALRGDARWPAMVRAVRPDRPPTQSPVRHAA